MRFSIGIADFSWPNALTEELTRVAVTAENTGLDTVWVPDHLLQADPHSTADSAMLEAYTTLGFLAARTSRIGLGTMVSAVTFRPPALLIKEVTTLDVISGGRARFGIGTGQTAVRGAIEGPICCPRPRGSNPQTRRPTIAGRVPILALWPLYSVRTSVSRRDGRFKRRFSVANHEGTR